jgi:hypothetical protein
MAAGRMAAGREIRLELRRLALPDHGLPEVVDAVGVPLHASPDA